MESDVLSPGRSGIRSGTARSRRGSGGSTHPGGAGSGRIRRRGAGVSWGAGPGVAVPRARFAVGAAYLPFRSERTVFRTDVLLERVYYIVPGCQ
jgi:hypothetical protein